MVSGLEIAYGFLRLWYLVFLNTLNRNLVSFYYLLIWEAVYVTEEMYNAALNQCILSSIYAENMSAQMNSNILYKILSTILIYFLFVFLIYFNK